MAVGVICAAVERDKKRTRRLGQNQTTTERYVEREKGEFDTGGGGCVG